MPNQRTDQAVIRWQRASATFDYYLTGLTVAVLALSIQTYSASPPLAWLVVTGWGLLTASLVAGLYRVEHWKLHLKYEAHRLLAEDKILEAQSEGGREEAKYRNRMRRVKEVDEKSKAKARWAYHIRWWTLLIGFVVLVLVKVLSATGWSFVG